MSPSDKESGGARRWVRIGCLGLAAIATVVALWTVVVIGFAWRGTRNETVERATLAFGPDVETQPARTQGVEATPDAPLHLVLDFTVGDFEVRPGSPGEAIRVTASYDRRSYALEESFEPGPPGAGTYRVRFHEIGWMRDSGLRVLFGGHRPEIVVELPPDVPIALEGRFCKGGAKVNLGGLWLTEIDLQIQKGGGHVGIDEPLVMPVERMRIHTRQGGFSTHRLGNASPGSLTVDSAIGPATIDLRGAWLQDGDVNVRHWLGGGNLLLPHNADVEGFEVPDRLAPSPNPEVPRSRIRLSVSHRLGALQVD